MDYRVRMVMHLRRTSLWMPGSSKLAELPRKLCRNLSFASECQWPGIKALRVLFLEK
jgi:hypothetical protein